MKTVGTARTNTKTKIKFQTGIRKERSQKQKGYKNKMSKGEFQSFNLPEGGLSKDELGESGNKKQQELATIIETGNFSFEDLAFKESDNNVSKEAAERAHNYRLELEKAKRGFAREIRRRKRETFGGKVANFLKRQAA